MRFNLDRDLSPLLSTIRCLPLCTMALLLALALGAGIYRSLQPCDPDPWACFGAGRYDAMRDGRVCECYQKEHLR